MTSTITIVGQSASGKTNMLASVLFNRNAYDDLSVGPDAVTAPTLELRHDDKPKSRERKNDKKNDEAERKDADVPDSRDHLRSHYSQMISGKDFLLGEGTNEVRTYPCTLEYQSISSEDSERRGGFLRMRRAPAETTERIDFDIVDGRGGDIAPAIPDSQLDNTARARRDRYRDALADSRGAIICMPVQKSAFRSDVVDRFLAELERVKRVKRGDPKFPRLTSVAICYTIYEEEFRHYGPDARDRASDPEEFRDIMSGHASKTMFKSLVNANRGSDAFALRFFPVSSYGFLQEGGSANFYDYPQAKGLKTRAIDPYDDYDNPDLPNYKAHFPYPMTEADAASMWQPFNVAPPVLFALTGRVTGPLSLSPGELGFDETI